MTQDDYQKIEAKEKSLDEINEQIECDKLKELLEITDAGHPGAKFSRFFEDMKLKLKLDERIKKDYEFSENDEKLLEPIKYIKENNSEKFSQLAEDKTDKDKFKFIFKNAYHKIILSFFTTMISLQKLKQDFCIVFRFFGNDESSIEEFLYEFNNFCDCNHPRFCGEYGYEKVKFDIEKEKKNYKIDIHSQEFMSVSYRNEKEKDEKFFFETMQQPNFQEIEELREAIEEYYTDSNNQGNGIQACTGYKDIYLTFMEKITQNSTFCILDDYSYYIHNKNKHGKLLLIDPYDIETLHIFFDKDLDKFPEKIDVIDVVTKKN